MSVLYHNQIIYIDWMTDYIIDIEKWLSERQEKYYLAYYEDYNKIEAELPSKDSSKYNIIYNDEYGFILERK